MPVERIEQLTQRQRECLRLYQQRYRVKEIARALGISENTASGYLTEAATLLGVGGRQAAAQALAAFEAAPGSEGPVFGGRHPVRRAATGTAEPEQFRSGIDTGDRHTRPIVEGAAAGSTGGRQ